MLRRSATGSVAISSGAATGGKGGAITLKVGESNGAAGAFVDDELRDEIHYERCKIRRSLQAVYACNGRKRAAAY